jgi:hypothetical protein
MGAGYVLSVGTIEGLHHLDAKASTVSEEHGQLGYGIRVCSVMLADRVAASSSPSEAKSYQEEQAQSEDQCSCATHCLCHHCSKPNLKPWSCLFCCV